MKTRAERMTDLLESCHGGFEQAVGLLREACAAQFSGEETTPELAALLAALEGAERAAAALDRATE